MTLVGNVEKDLKAKSSKARALSCLRFFKTGKGQYGEGDVFMGVTVPDVRLMFKTYKDGVNLEDAEILLKNKFHELRLFGIFGLIYLYQKEKYPKKKIFDLYVENVGFGKGINNWDLIDTSADKIVGDYLYNHATKKEKSDFIKKYIISTDLWVRRMVVIASFYDIKKGDSQMTLLVCKILLNDKHDLIHKATGWMLREVGKRVSELDLVKFLNQHKPKMAKVSYRYAIERIKNSLTQ